MGAQQEEHNGHTKQELLGRGILVAVVDLLPHVEIIIRPGVELERYAPHVVEHEEGAEHVADVGEGPRRLLRDPGDNVVEDLERGNQDEMDRPGAWIEPQSAGSPTSWLSSPAAGTHLWH